MFLYDVAFSYAGEDREYVERVAKAVEGRIRVFYDRHEQIDLWGKNLHTHLAEVYGQRSRFCVMFLSASYARKVWTNHERENAQARAFSDHETYILPARFDDTTIPGVLVTTGYVDLRSIAPEAFAELLVEKVRAVGPGALVHAGAQAPHSSQRRRPGRWLAVTFAAVGAGLAIGASLVDTSSEVTGPRDEREVVVSHRDVGRLLPDQRIQPASSGTRAGTTRSTPSPVAAPRQTRRVPDGPVREQVLRADGTGSVVVLDGSMRMNHRESTSAHQEVSAASGGEVTISGDMTME